MGTFDIFKKALDKAISKGYKPSFDWRVESVRIMDGTNYYSVIFDKAFMEAIWGTDVQFLNYNTSHSHLGENCVLWQWHGKQMLMAEEPLKYLEKNLDRDNWKYILEA